MQPPRQIHQRPQPVLAPQISLVVITPERTQKWNEQIEAGDKAPYAFFGYSEDQYLDFAKWLQDVLRFIRSQNSVIEAYEQEAIRVNSSLSKSQKDD